MNKSEKKAMKKRLNKLIKLSIRRAKRNGATYQQIGKSLEKIKKGEL